MPSKPSVPSRRTVLLIDQSDDSREVLRTVLERRGVQIFEASHAEQGLELARQHHPRVIVMDLEAVPRDDLAIHDDFAAQSAASGSRMVLLGSVKWIARAKEKALVQFPDSNRTSQSFVAKPYHYGPLISKIEQLLESNPVISRAA